MKVIIIDTETTGLVNPQAIEIAYIDIQFDLPDLKDSFIYSNTYCERFKPSKSIDLGASKVNGIYMKDLINCRKSEEFILPKVDYIIGHNIAFDHRVLGKPDVKLICTKELSQLVFNRIFGIQNNKLTTLIEFWYPGEGLTKNAHGAAHDCKLVYLLLIKILEKLPNIKTWEELANLCSQGKKTYEELDKTIKKLGVMPFGKYKGELFNQIPKDYLKWLSKQNNLSPSLELTIKSQLQNI